MERINKQYIKISRISIFSQQIIADEESNKLKKGYFEKITRVLLDYNKKERKFVKEIYIPVDSPTIKTLFNLSQIPITRESIVNATLQASLDNDFEKIKELQPFLLKSEILPSELGSLLEYVLENNISINEYLNGEWSKIIYNEEENKFEKKCIHGNKSGKAKNLELK